MNDRLLNRRNMLSGGVTLASTTLVSRPVEVIPPISTAVPVGTIREETLALVGMDGWEAEVRDAIRHAPFRAEFLTWLLR